MVWRDENLSYCTNVHPGESVRELLDNLSRFVGPVRSEAGLSVLTAGLWLSNKASLELTDFELKRSELKRCLAGNGLTLNSLNGFPFGDFHQDEIKQDVYLPDWSEPCRLEYTVRLAELLASVMEKDETSGTISTLPLGFSRCWTAEKHQASLKHFCQLAEKLAEIEHYTGKHIRVCLEMEPACALEKTPEIIAFFNADLADYAKAGRFDGMLLKRYLGVCYDVCHQAVMFENIRDSLEAITAGGITIGKIQLSSALRLTDCTAESAREKLLDFAEPRYLHQTSVKMHDGSIRYFSDLAPALESAEDCPGQEWRVHYHVPVQLSRGLLADSEAGNESSSLGTTQFALESVFEFLAAHPSLKPHLEVETYTWHVLPQSLRPDDDSSLVRGIVSELDYVRQSMAAHGLLNQETHVSRYTANAHRTD